MTEDQLRIDSEIKRGRKAAMNMGLDRKQADTSMKYYKFSDVRMKNISRGVLERPTISAILKKDLLQMGPVGADRYKAAEAILRSYKKRIALED